MSQLTQEGLYIIVLGVTGAVGREIVETLYERKYPSKRLRVFSTEKSVGERVDYGDEEIVVENLENAPLSEADIVFVTLPYEASRDYSAVAVQGGAVVVQIGGCVKIEGLDELLVVPEVNGEQVLNQLSELASDEGALFSVPLAASLALAVVLNPLKKVAPLRRIVASTYQGASSAGRSGMDELWQQTLAMFNSGELPSSVFPKQLAFNCIPQIDELDPDGYSREEKRIVAEAQAIISEPKLPISVTAVQVPVFSCVALSVHVEFDCHVSGEVLRTALREAPGVVLQETTDADPYPTHFEIAGSDAVYVGRMRVEPVDKQTLSENSSTSFWVVADNLRKGAAVSAVEIAEIALGSPRFARNLH